MKTSIQRFWPLFAIVVIVGGCASQPKLTNEQVLNLYPSLIQLNSAYEQAGKEGADLLAPQGYAEAGRSLDRALAAARANNDNGVKTAVAEGLQWIDKLKQDAQKSRNLLAEVLQKRADAYTVGANTLQAQKMADLDSELKKTAALVEQGDLEQAKQRRPKLLSGYSQLELDSLKLGTIDLAKAAISDAKRQGAHKFAPQTLAQAEEEMALALSILDADRTQTDKANMHATNARWLAQQSASITETIKDFDRRDYSMEDVVLWHQRQLKTINAPLGGQLPFNEPSDKVVEGLRNAVSTLVSDRDSARNLQQQAMQQNAALITEHQQALNKLRTQYDKQLAMTEQQRQELLQMDQAEREKFEAVQALFSEQEAKVYRQRKNILISVQGFEYPSGQSEIKAANFPLMNKIVRAVKTFPDARIEVNGHTDATGNDTNNQILSQARAEKVAQFLMDVGGVNQDKITAQGFGEAKPVASNDTREGRAENRRIEVVIVNE